jgi:hypothetical protein
MSLPINIDEILRGRLVERERIEFKEGWNPEAVLHTICAFANDFHNLGGGYILIGVAADQGRPELPPVGIDPNRLDSIQQELLGSVAKNILAIFCSSDELVVVTTSCIVSEFLQQNRAFPSQWTVHPTNKFASFTVKVTLTLGGPGVNAIGDWQYFLLLTSPSGAA